MNRYRLFSMVIIGISLLLAGCGREKIESRNIVQIYQAEGVPVRVMKVKSGEFVTELRYHAVLKGNEETSVYAPIGDKIDQVRVNVGDVVAKDQILVTFPMDNPQANYYQAKTNFENAGRSYERMKTLYQSGGISQQDLDNAQAVYDVAKANWDAVRQGVLVKSPMAGVVTQLNVQPTDNVQAEDLLLTVSRVDRVRAKIWLSEDEIHQISKGCPAYAVWNGESYRGVVSEVDWAVNPQTRGFGAVVILENPGRKLPCGVTAEIVVEAYRNPMALMTEQKNILQDSAGHYVYVAVQDKAVRRPIQVGRHNGLVTEITGGLSPEESLIVEGQLLLEPDKKIKIIP